MKLIIAAIIAATLALYAGAAGATNPIPTAIAVAGAHQVDAGPTVAPPSSPAPGAAPTAKVDAAKGGESPGQGVAPFWILVAVAVMGIADEAVSRYVKSEKTKGVISGVIDLLRAALNAWRDRGR